jgi:5'-deoxynucleotidase YfbR-like HD superfamily hydrolase
MAYGAPIDTSIFPPEREARLKGIFRYNLFDTLLYRSNDWMHERRVSWLTEEIGALLTPHADFDLEKARTLALVHDDAEIITGDVQAGHKAQMTAAELAAVDTAEEDAIEELAKTYPKEVNGYSYRDLLLSALKKDTFEAQLVSYADKFDAYGEGMHELLAGNITLLTSFAFYTRFFAQVKTSLPLLVPALDAAEKSPFIYPFIQSPIPGKQVTVAAYRTFSGKPHTKETLAIDTERFPFYDAWKKVVQERGGEEGTGWLLTQREFMPA